MGLPWLDIFLQRAEADPNVRALESGAGRDQLVRSLRAVAMELPPVELADLMLTDQGFAWAAQKEMQERGAGGGSDHNPPGRLPCSVGDLALMHQNGSWTSEGLGFVAALSASTGRGVASLMTVASASGQRDASVAFAILLAGLSSPGTSVETLSPDALTAQMLGAGETLRHALDALPWQFRRNPTSAREVAAEIQLMQRWLGEGHPKAFFERAPAAASLFQLDGVLAFLKGAEAPTDMLQQLNAVATGGSAYLSQSTLHEWNDLLAKHADTLKNVAPEQRVAKLTALSKQAAADKVATDAFAVAAARQEGGAAAADAVLVDMSAVEAIRTELAAPASKEILELLSETSPPAHIWYAVVCAGCHKTFVLATSGARLPDTFPLLVRKLAGLTASFGDLLALVLSHELPFEPVRNDNGVATALLAPEHQSSSPNLPVEALPDKLVKHIMKREFNMLAPADWPLLLQAKLSVPWLRPIHRFPNLGSMPRALTIIEDMLPSVMRAGLVTTEPVDGASFGELCARLKHAILVDCAEWSDEEVAELTNDVFAKLMNDVSRRALNTARAPGHTDAPAMVHRTDTAWTAVDQIFRQMAAGLQSRTNELGSRPVAILAPRVAPRGAGPLSPASGGKTAGGTPATGGGGGGGGGLPGGGGSSGGGGGQHNSTQYIVAGGRGSIDTFNRDANQMPRIYRTAPKQKPGSASTFEEEAGYFVHVHSAGRMFVSKSKLAELLKKLSTRKFPFKAGTFLVSPLIAPVDHPSSAVTYVADEKGGAGNNDFVLPHPDWFSKALVKPLIDTKKSGALPPYFQ
jgi:hypothetical protein